MQKLENLKKTPGIFNLNYLSLYLAKKQKQGQFWIAENMQILKLTFLFEFGENLRELWPKYKL